MPISTHQIHLCINCNNPAISVGERIQRLDSTSTPPLGVRGMCLAHARQARWEEVRPPEGYGYWGCHNCRNEYLTVPLNYDGPYGTLYHEYEYYVGDYHYNISESPLYVSLDTGDLCDELLSVAFHQAPTGNIDLNVPDIGPPDSISDFLAIEAYSPIRESIYDDFSTGHITCTGCGSEIDGDLH